MPTLLAKHGAWVQNGFVHLTNDDDSYYQEVFKTPEELSDFIKHLTDIGIEAWGSKRFPPEAPF